MNKLAVIFLSAVLFGSPRAFGEQTLLLSLDQVIDRARMSSVEAASALDELRSAYWEWRTWKADQLPEVSFKATLPSFANRYSTFMDAEGNYSFVQNKALQLDATLSVKQNVRLTGATLSMSTSLDFLRQFDGLGNRYMSIPFAVSIDQPLFGFNYMKWNSRIEPVRYSEAKAAFMSATEDVAISAVGYYFDLLMSRENLAIARQNLDNAERLYGVATEKRRMGQISENDLRQMELNLLDARSDLTDCRSTVRASMFRLRTFLDLGEDTELEPLVPDSVPLATVSYADALDRALANNKFARSIARRQLEADYAVAKAKGDLRQINLFVQLGTTGASGNLSDAYSRLRGNQVVEVGVEIPLIDWGRRRGRVKVAESNRRVQQSTLRKETMDFNQDLFILVERFCNQQEQLAIAARASELAAQRYATNVETFLIGKISTLDLNDSQVKKDESRRLYINELYKYWLYWYQLRSLTLYDFEKRTDIDADIERIIRDK